MERKKRWRWTVIKRELTDIRAKGACNFGRKNPHPLPEQLLCGHDSSWCTEESLWGYSQSLLHYQLQIINVLRAVCFSTPYSIMLRCHHSRCGPHGTVGRSASVPGHALTIAMECSGCFIACGSNYTHIWWSFVEIKLIAALSASHTSHTARSVTNSD